MFSDLPLFLGVGFCIGLLWRRLQSEFGAPASSPPTGAPPNSALMRGVKTDHEVEPASSAEDADGDAEIEYSWAEITRITPTRAVALLLMALFLWRSYAVAGLALSSGTGLSLAAGLVGWVAGRWFANGPEPRDKGVAIAAAALFLATAAWEYETHGLRNITKFSAGSVDLELSAHLPTSDAAQTASLVKGEINNNPFPGRNRLERALAFLKNLQRDMDRDERFAEMFSGYDREASRKKVEPIFELRTAAFKNFYQKTIMPLVCKFGELQNFHKGEVSSISVTTSLIRELRLAYETNAMLVKDDGAVTLEKSAFLTAYGDADKEAGFDKSANLDVKTPPDVCDAVSPPSELPPVLAGNPTTDQDARAFMAYFAITSALAEFAIDNRERAIQLLDDVVVHPSPYGRDETKGRGTPLPAEQSLAYQNCPEGSPGETCRQAAKRLEQARGLVLRARMEQVIDAIIDVADNADLTAIRISLVERAIKDEDHALDLFHTAVGFDRKPFFDLGLGKQKGECRFAFTADAASRALLARWIAAETTLRANALQAAAQRPDVVAARPYLIADLTDDADTITNFDADCASELVAACAKSFTGTGSETACGTGLGANLRAILLEPVAQYWEAKGNRFGASEATKGWLAEPGSDAADQIRALCSAERTYQFAQGIYQTTAADAANKSKPDDATATLDDRGNAFGAPSFTDRMESGIARTKAALNRFAAGEVDEYCK